MTRPPILQPGTSYTFSKYFELPYAPADILAEFDFKYERKRLDLPRYADKVNCLEFLSSYLQIGIFHRREKIISQDLKLYRVPEELEELLRVLVGIIVRPLL
jgi:hypothetical protein